jgi:O-antigen/teichoic acid export membrane protein
MISAGKMVRGFLYTLVGGYLARLSSVLLTVLISRELGPNLFADVVVGVTVFTVLSSLREFGLMHALLHYQSKVSEFVGTHLILNVMLTAGSALVSSSLAWLLMVLFPAHFSLTSALVVWVFSGLNLIRNVTLTSEGLLRMEFEFGRLSLFHGVGTILALLSTLLAARAGWGASSLILGGWSTISVLSIIYVLFFSTATLLTRPVALHQVKFDPVWARRLLSYGIWIWVGWVLQTFMLWYDRLVIWWVLGKVEMALYNHAIWLVQIPTAVISHIIFSYTNALYSRYKDDSERLSVLFGRMLTIIVRISSPLALIFVLNANELMRLMPKWVLAAPMVVWLAMFAFARPLLDEGFGLLWAVGATRLSAAIMALQAVLALVVLPTCAVVWGVAGVAYGMGAVTVVGLIGLFTVVRKFLTVDLKGMFAVPALSLGLAALAGVAMSEHTVDRPVFDFVVKACSMAGVYMTVLGTLERKRIREGFKQLKTILQRPPQPANEK